MKLNKNEQNYLLTILFKSYILQSVICSGIILVCTVSLDMGLTWVLDRYVEHYYLIYRGLYVYSQERINVFMEHLNNYLQNQGYENTILYDPSGYDVNALTTVSDLKSVSTHLLEKQWFRDIVSKSNYTATLPDGSTQTWRNTNTFLDQTSEYYNENVKGIKTGSLSNDYNLVVLYQQHGKEFLICSLGSQSDSSRYDDVNYILKTIDESDYLTK